MYIFIFNLQSDLPVSTDVKKKQTGNRFNQVTVGIQRRQDSTPQHSVGLSLRQKRSYIRVQFLNTTEFVSITRRGSMCEYYLMVNWQKSNETALAVSSMLIIFLFQNYFNNIQTPNISDIFENNNKNVKPKIGRK